MSAETRVRFLVQKNLTGLEWVDWAFNDPSMTEEEAQCSVSELRATRTSVKYRAIKRTITDEELSQ